MKKIILILIVVVLTTVVVNAQKSGDKSNCNGKYSKLIVKVEFKGKAFKSAKKDFKGKYDLGKHGMQTVGGVEVSAGYWVYLKEGMPKVATKTDEGTHIAVGTKELMQMGKSLLKAPVLYVWAEKDENFVASPDAIAASTGTNETGTVTDGYGQVYKTVKINERWWMAENLNSTNKDLNSTYGQYYSWNSAKLYCPSGWRVPTLDECKELVNAYGGEKQAGMFLKSSSFGGNNASGFNAIGAGSRMNTTDEPNQIGTNIYIWTSDQYNTDRGGNSSSGYYMNLSQNSKWVTFGGSVKFTHQSVRCIKEE